MQAYSGSDPAWLLAAKVYEADKNAHCNRGAALSKLPREAEVVATSATKHYGTQAGSLFDPQIDVDVETYTDKFTGKKRAKRVCIRPLSSSTLSLKLTWPDDMVHQYRG